jgi:hypothetical protein
MQQSETRIDAQRIPVPCFREDMIPAVQRTVAEMAELLGISRQYEVEL